MSDPESSTPDNDAQPDAARDSRKKPPKLGQGVSHERTTEIDSGTLNYRAVADWIVLHKRDQPIASMFYTGYFVADRDPATRPLTFVFNGGPGAASAFLHVAAVGPRRVAFADDGGVAAPPVRLIDNLETWLSFTDLVCVDPIGTGFSRTHEHGDANGGAASESKPANADAKPKPSQFWEVKRDLESIGELIARILTTYDRWASPVAVAGESYGGFRVARLARTLQEDVGVGLNAAILISPAIEFSTLLGSDYNLDPWIDIFPSMAATAYAHGVAGQGRSFDEHRVAAEEFAISEWIGMLAMGERMPSDRRRVICERASGFIGLPADMLHQALGRVSNHKFCRELLRDKRLYVGKYDGTMTSVDPFPDRAAYAGPDSTLQGQTRVFTAGINAHLRQDLGVQTDLDYLLINMEANASWRDDGLQHFAAQIFGSMDSLRYGMALNPEMRVLISHGFHDLVTPYASADRLVRLMKLETEQKARVHIEHFPGGHMFYTRDDSRRAFGEVVRASCFVPYGG